jgi:hypothetical protein
LVAYLLWEQRVAGSNPAIPIDYYKNTPKGIRIPVVSVKGRCPRPLDDGGFLGYLGLEPRTIQLKAEYSTIELVTPNIMN